MWTKPFSTKKLNTADKPPALATDRTLQSHSLNHADNQPVIECLCHADSPTAHPQGDRSADNLQVFSCGTLSIQTGNDLLKTRGHQVFHQDIVISGQVHFPTVDKSHDPLTRALMQAGQTNKFVSLHLVLAL